MRKTFEKLVTDSLCCVPCYAAKYAFVVIFIYDILLSRLSCHSQHVTHFFSAAKVESRTSIRAFFSYPISQSSSVFIGGIYEVTGTSLSSVSASCSFKSVALKYRQDHVRLLFATFLSI